MKITSTILFLIVLLACCIDCDASEGMKPQKSILTINPVAAIYEVFCCSPNPSCIEDTAKEVLTSWSEAVTYSEIIDKVVKTKKVSNHEAVQILTNNDHAQ